MSVPQTAQHALAICYIEIARFTACPCRFSSSLLPRLIFRYLSYAKKDNHTMCYKTFALTNLFFLQFNKLNKFTESSEASFVLLWLELLIVRVQLVRTIVQISLGTGARVSRLMTLILRVVWVALVGTIILVSLGLLISVLTFVCHGVNL